MQIVVILKVGSLAEDVNGIIVVPLGNECLGQCDVHIDLHELHLRYLWCQLFCLMQCERDVLNGLFYAIKGQVSFSQVIMCQH